MGPTTDTGTVPVTTGASQAQQETASGGVDVISQLVSAANAANARAAQAMKTATVPIAGGHQQPTAVNLPGAGRQYKQFELDNSPVVGRHQATMQGIANLSKSVANVVGQVEQQRDQKKTQELAVNIEHLMGAVNSADQAKQVLAQDPNNQAAQEQLRKATAIQNEVLNDDKNRKAIAKAFNINFTDPSKNNTPEHAALKQASDSYAKQFTDKLPSTMAPNQQAIAEAQAAQTEAKATNAIVEKLTPAIVAAQSRQNVAETKAAQDAKDAKLRYDAAVYTANSRYQAAVKGANIHVQGMLQAVRLRDQTLLDVAQKRIDELTGVNGKSPKAMQDAQRAFDSITRTLNTYQQQINLLEQNRKQADPSRVDFYDKQIQVYESQGEVLQMKQKELADRLSKAGETPTVSSDQETGAASGTGSGPNYISDGDDDPDSFDQ